MPRHCEVVWHSLRALICRPQLALSQPGSLQVLLVCVVGCIGCAVKVRKKKLCSKKTPPVSGSMRSRLYGFISQGSATRTQAPKSRERGGCLRHTRHNILYIRCPTSVTPWSSCFIVVPPSRSPFYPLLRLTFELRSTRGRQCRAALMRGYVIE